MKNNKKSLFIAAIAVLAVVSLITIVQGPDQKSSNKRISNVNIGSVLSMSGPASYYGQSTLRGIQLAIDEYTQANPDVNISLVNEDSALNPTTGTSAFNKLKNIDKVDAVIVQGGNIGVALHKANENNPVLLIGASVLSADFKAENDMSYRLTADGKSEIE